jgi:hypothetical protein
MRVYRARMGSSGSKPRKRKRQGKATPQHLPKVGTATENERLLHEEQHAVAAQMGLGNVSPTTRWILIGIAVVIVVAAIIGLIGLNTF